MTRLWAQVTTLGLVMVVSGACSAAATPTPSVPPPSASAVVTATASQSSASPAASGSGAPCDPSKAVKLALMLKDLTASGPTAFLGMANDAKVWAAQNCVDLTVQDLYTSGDGAITAVDTVIGAGIQGIVISVPDVSIGPAIAAKAAAAHVPLLAVFDQFKDQNGNINPFYGLDDAAYGKASGDEIVKLYNAAGWASDKSLVVRGADIDDPTIPACVLRQNGAAAELKAGIPGFTAQDVIDVVYKNDEQTAIDAMASTITAHPEVTNWMIFSCNDLGVVGAVRALESAGVPANKAIVVGQGAAMACQEFAKTPQTSYMGSTYIDFNKAAAESLGEVRDAVLNSTPLPANVSISAAS